ncbi:MAG: lipid A biosynthesis acyltransferase [Planctomycetes bacterium]|nr:lipid A biosynthesis acyltransferase [Planctomycetota bacterium]
MTGRPANWLSRRERGTVLGIRAAFRFATLVGRTPTKLLVAGIALWYRLFDRRSVRASQDWLRRATGRKPGFWAVWRHLRTFAQVTLDRAFLLTGKTNSLVFTRTGLELLEQQQASGKGAVLIGAHLGSYEAMRAGGRHDDLRIRIVGYFANARMINELMYELNPSWQTQVIHLGDDPVQVMANVQDAVERGEFVAMMADRTGLNDRLVDAQFFGERASFNSGPFLLASILGCPVYLVFGVYRAPNRYELHCERFADRVVVPRKDRDGALRRWAQAYADRIEHHARQAPDNWFNFFDFWAPRAAAPASPPRSPDREQEAAP